MPGYVTAKAGIMGLTKSLAKDYGEHNLRVNAILPGWVATERQLQTWLTPEAEREWMQQVALQSRLMPQDVANFALFLAADDSNMISGQSFVIDGGRPTFGARAELIASQASGGTAPLAPIQWRT